MEQTGKFSNGRAALGLLALVILAAAQLARSFWQACR